MATNTILEKKSEIFTQAMKKKDFRFPVRCIGGNPTVKKEYDEGYFLTDSDHRLFHLKQLRGRPYFRPIPLPKGIEITHIFVKEYPNRKFYALLTDQENNLWALSNPDYQLYPLPIGKYDPRQDDIQIIGDSFQLDRQHRQKRRRTYFRSRRNGLFFGRYPDLSATKQHGLKNRTLLFPGRAVFCLV